MQAGWNLAYLRHAHLKFNERIQDDCGNIKDADLLDLVQRLHQLLNS